MLKNVSTLLSQPSVNLLNFLLQDNAPEVYSSQGKHNLQVYYFRMFRSPQRGIKHYQSDSWVQQQISENVYTLKQITIFIFQQIETEM